MAAPIPNKAILPDDSGNAGKKMRTQTRLVGSDTVHEHMTVGQRQAQIFGVYMYAGTQYVILASAQNGTSTGFLWFSNPVATTNKKLRIRRLSGFSQHTTAFAGVSGPRLAVTKYTFTGTASGATVTPVKVDTTSAGSFADLRTAVTGMTVTLVGALGFIPIAGALTAVGAYAPAEVNAIGPNDNDFEDEFVVCAPGEGVVVYQDVAGTTSDTRVAQIRMVWDENDTA